MESVEIFKTNVQDEAQAEHVIALLRSAFPQYKLNFDLHDCDRVLRVAAMQICPSSVELAVQQAGFLCSHIL